MYLFKPQTTNHKPQTTNHKPQTTNHKPQTTNLKAPRQTFKNRLGKVFLLFFVQLAFVSCLKEKIKKNEHGPNLRVEYQAKEKDSSKGNAAKLSYNFEHIGIWHNSVMDSVANSTNILSPIDSVVYSVLKRESESFYNGYQYVSFSEYLNRVSSAKNYNLNYFDVSHELGNDYSNFSSRMQSMIELLEESMNSINPHSTGVEPTPEVFNDVMESLEMELISSFGMPIIIGSETNDVGFIFASIAIAKSSADYWYSAAHDNSSSWYGIFGNVDSDPIELVSGWWARMMADARGFFRGGWATGNGVDNGEPYIEITGTADAAGACAAEYSASV